MYSGLPLGRLEGRGREVKESHVEPVRLVEYTTPWSSDELTDSRSMKHLDLHAHISGDDYFC